MLYLERHNISAQSIYLFDILDIRLFKPALSHFLDYPLKFSRFLLYDIYLGLNIFVMTIYMIKYNRTCIHIYTYY